MGVIGRMTGVQREGPAELSCWIHGARQ